MFFTALRIMEKGQHCKSDNLYRYLFSISFGVGKNTDSTRLVSVRRFTNGTETPKQPNQKQLFLDALLAEFSRQDYLKVANGLEIFDKTAEKYISKFVQNGLINHFAHDKYKK